MNKATFAILVFVGTAVLYLLALMITTTIVSYILNDHIGDTDHAMIYYATTANVIQFIVILGFIADNVGRWVS